MIFRILVRSFRVIQKSQKRPKSSQNWSGCVWWPEGTNWSKGQIDSRIIRSCSSALVFPISTPIWFPAHPAHPGLGDRRTQWPRLGNAPRSTFCASRPPFMPHFLPVPSESNWSNYPSMPWWSNTVSFVSEAPRSFVNSFNRLPHARPTLGFGLVLS